MTSEAIDVELYLQLFSGLIQSYMDKSDYEMFTQKINEHSMIKDPNFRWCIKVSPVSGLCNYMSKMCIYIIAYHIMIVLYWFS